MAKVNTGIKCSLIEATNYTLPTLQKGQLILGEDGTIRYDNSLNKQILYKTLTNGSVITDYLANNSVTNLKIQDNAIQSHHLSANTKKDIVSSVLKNTNGNNAIDRLVVGLTDTTANLWGVNGWKYLINVDGTDGTNSQIHIGTSNTVNDGLNSFITIGNGNVGKANSRYLYINGSDIPNCEVGISTAHIKFETDNFYITQYSIQNDDYFDISYGNNLAQLGRIWSKNVGNNDHSGYIQNCLFGSTVIDSGYLIFRDSSGSSERRIPSDKTWQRASTDDMIYHTNGVVGINANRLQVTTNWSDDNGSDGVDHLLDIKKNSIKLRNQEQNSMSKNNIIEITNPYIKIIGDIQLKDIKSNCPTMQNYCTEEEDKYFTDNSLQKILVDMLRDIKNLKAMTPTIAVGTTTLTGKEPIGTIQFVVN